MFLVRAAWGDVGPLPLTRQLRHFLLNGQVTLVTDHATLKRTTPSTAPDAYHKWQRWALKLRAFDRLGKETANADGLS